MPRNIQGVVPAVSAPLAVTLLVIVLFALVQPQDPLYSGNQTDHSLRAVAQSGTMNLDHDWTANTVDPLPLFTALSVPIIQLRLEFLFRVIYTIGLAFFFASLVLLCIRVLRWDPDEWRVSVFAVVLLAISTPVTWDVFSGIFSREVYFDLTHGVAGQNLTGPLLQPNTFGIFAILAITAYAYQRFRAALLLAFVAVAFHPEYLPAYLSVCAAIVIGDYRVRRDWKRSAGYAVVAIVLLVPILAYVLIVFGPSTPENARMAADILAYERIPHHTLASQWFSGWTVVRIVVMGLGCYLVARTSAFLPIAILTLGTLVSSVAIVLLGNSSLLLLMPWRSSVLLAPLSTAIVVATVVGFVWQVAERRKWTVRKPVLVTALLAFLLATVSVAMLKSDYDYRRRMNNPERQFARLAASHSDPNVLYAVPTNMEDFRLTAGMPIVADFKSPTFRDVDTLEWDRRITDLRAFYDPNQGMQERCDRLNGLKARYGITHLVAERTLNVDCPGATITYGDDNYVAFVLAPRPVD